MLHMELLGGYGEHGRNCYLVEYRENHYYLLDCGVMDSETIIEPHIDYEKLLMTDYVFITHCHKDHVGAFNSFVSQGFHGLLVTTQMTYNLYKMTYANVLFLDMKEKHLKLNGLEIEYGCTGHCAGSIWLYINDFKHTLFYSGDYQKDTLSYQCDEVKGKEADFALIDMAHADCLENGQQLREELISKIKEINQAGKQVILPIQKYGRGIEMIALFQQMGIHFACDKTVMNCCLEMLEEDCWYKNKIDMNTVHCVSVNDSNCSNYEVLLMGDTHLAKEKNRQYVAEKIESDQGVLIITGRLKKGSYNEELMKENKALRFSYPHHQSRTDFNEMIQQNNFKIVLPFHNFYQEVYFK